VLAPDQYFLNPLLTCQLTCVALTANKLFLIKPNWPQKFFVQSNQAVGLQHFPSHPSAAPWPRFFPFLSHDNL